VNRLATGRDVGVAPAVRTAGRSNLNQSVQPAPLAAMGGHRFGHAAIRGALPLWGLIAVLLSAYLLAYTQDQVRFKTANTLAVALIAIILSCAAVFYTKARCEDRLARLFRAVVELILLAFFTGGLSYTAAALNRPLWDDSLDGWDQSLGFHWREWLNLLNAHPDVNVLLVISYHSMVPQLACALIALVTARAYRTLDIFLIAFGIAATVSVTVSGGMPALSPLVHYGILPSDYPNISLAVPLEFADHVRALRDGSMHMIDLGGAQGLVTFPSFHTACGVLLVLAFWRIPYVRWLGLILNSIMLLAVPIEGSHYLLDLFAGIAVALFSWYLARKMVTREADT
jgi:hypothetical protein